MDAQRVTESLALRLAHSSRLLQQLYMRRLEPLRLTVPQMFVLLVLFNEDGCQARVVSERLHMDKATLSGVLTRLEGEGVIKRLPDSSDQRSHRLTLTERGWGLRRSLHTLHQEVNEQVQAQLGLHGPMAIKVLEALEETLERLALAR